MAGGASRAGRLFTWTLAFVVGALMLSWACARLWPRSDRMAVGTEGRLIRVQVLNGSRESGVGARVAHVLREGGFQVVEVANADRSDYEVSMVVARREDPTSARVVARYLGDPPVIRQAWASDLADVTVVIGGDRSRLRIE